MSQVNEISPLRARPGQWLAQGWDWFIEDPAKHLLLGLIATSILIVSQGLLLGPIMLGLAAVGILRVKEKRVDLGNFFECLPYFLPSFLSGILVLGFSLIGIVFLVVPGVVIFAMYIFSFHFIQDQEEDFWGAMESSRKMVARDYLGFSLFGAAVLGLNLLGLTFFLLGLVVTIPVTSLAITAAYFQCLENPVQEAPPPPDATPVHID